MGSLPQRYPIKLLWFDFLDSLQCAQRSVPKCNEKETVQQRKTVSRESPPRPTRSVDTWGSKIVASGAEIFPGKFLVCGVRTGSSGA